METDTSIHPAADEPQQHVDIVIRMFGDREAELRERVIELEGEQRWLRNTLHEAVTMLHRSNMRLDRQTQTILHLRRQIRHVFAVDGASSCGIAA